MTVRRLVASLRRGREALADVEAQLDALLRGLRSGGRTLDATAPDRLACAAREAGSALGASLGSIRQVLPQRR